MQYLSFDVSKAEHECVLLDEDESVCFRLRFTADRAGFEQLQAQLEPVDAKSVVAGLEATGRYWETLYLWLLRWDPFKLMVLNPLQTRAFRNANLRGSKTDPLDAHAIARLLRWSHQTLGTSHVPQARQAAAREVSRMRTELKQQRTTELARLGGVLAAVFPEFESVLKPATKSARAVLLRWPTPTHLVVEATEEELAALLRKTSRGRCGRTQARELLERARASVGVPDEWGGRATVIRTLVNLIEPLEEQIRELGEHLDALLAAEAADAELLSSIPGFGVETVRTWLAEGLPIEKYRAKDGASRLVAALGIDAQLKQSGRYTGRVKMSKRGNRYLRRAVILAARTAARSDPQFAAILRRHLQRGKHYNVAISHVARKLVHVVYSVLINRRPYSLPSEYLLGVVEEPEAAASGA